MAYIKGLRLKSRIFEVLGRGLLWTSRNPLTFGAGVGFLFLHRNIEAIEIGHNVLHGQYDYFPEIPNSIPTTLSGKHRLMKKVGVVSIMACTTFILMSMKKTQTSIMVCCVLTI